MSRPSRTLRVIGPNAENEAILRHAVKIYGVHYRVIRARQSAQQHDAKNAVSDALKIPNSNVIGMNEGHEWYGLPPMFSG